MGQYFLYIHVSMVVRLTHFDVAQADVFRQVDEVSPGAGLELRQHMRCRGSDFDNCRVVARLHENDVGEGRTMLSYYNFASGEHMELIIDTGSLQS